MKSRFTVAIFLLSYFPWNLLLFANPQINVRALIPIGKVQVEVMQIGSSPRMIELTEKLQAAISKDPSWWQEHVSKAEPGKELPYDSRMGLTQSEYAELKVLSKQMRLNKLADASLEISKNDQGIFLLNGGSSLPELTGIEIDLALNKVKTPFGILEDSKEIQPEKDQTVTGPWGGMQWKLEKQGSSPGSGTIVKLALGKRVDDGRGILYYDVKSVTPGKTPVRISRILLYHLKQ